MSNKTRKIDLIDLINTPWLPKFSFQWDGITAAILNWWDLEMVQPVSTRPLRPLRSIQFPPVLLQSSTAQASALQSQPGESMVSRENRQKPMGLPEFFIWRLHGITDTNSGNAARVRSIYESKVESQTPAVASIQHRRPLSNLSSVFHPASQRVPWYQILNQTNTH